MRPYAFKRAGSLKPKTVRKEPERQAQIAFVTWCGYCVPDDVEWGATLNGVYLGQSQRAIAKAMGLRPGALDMFFVVDFVTRWLEWKSPTGTLTADQKRFISRQRPENVAVCRTLEDGEAALIRFGVKLKPYAWR